MTVMLNSTMAVEQARERRWGVFLSSLRPWELHALMRLNDQFEDSMELFLHDQFVEGNVSLMDVRVVIAAELEHL